MFWGGLFYEKMKKQISLLLAIISILTMCNFYAQAKEPTGIYKEKHEQINFKHTYFAEENNSLTVNLTNKNFIDRYFGEKEKTEITTILARYPEMESALLNVINHGEKVCAIAYTEVPILIFDDHTERVKEENEPSLVAQIFSSVFPIAKAAQTQTGETAYEAQQNFVMFTHGKK